MYMVWYTASCVQNVHLKAGSLHLYVQFQSDFSLNLICLQLWINNWAEQLMSSSSVIRAEPPVTSTTSIFRLCCDFIAWPSSCYCIFFISWIHLVKNEKHKLTSETVRGQFDLIWERWCLHHLSVQFVVKTLHWWTNFKFLVPWYSYSLVTTGWIVCYFYWQTNKHVSTQQTKHKNAVV